jgi:hypothetical protein
MPAVIRPRILFREKISHSDYSRRRKYRDKENFIPPPLPSYIAQQFHVRPTFIHVEGNLSLYSGGRYQ